MISETENKDNKNNDYNNDLEWYSNNLIDEDNNQDEGNNNQSNSYNIKIKKKKKKKKGKKKNNRENENEDEDEKKTEVDSINKGYHYGNDLYGKNISIINKNSMNKTMSQLKNAYTIFRENYSSLIKRNIKLKRLVIITNLGNNFTNSQNNFNQNKLIRQTTLNDPNMGTINKNVDTKDKLTKKNSLLPILKDNIVNENQNERNRIMSKIVGYEDNSFLSNIKRDYLNYNDAIYFDNRDYFRLYAHFLKLKNDLINIFCCKYSFAPYSIRLIKFLFFFHFMFYLEAICIGQKYYFQKHYSKEYQDFSKRMNYFSNNNLKLDNSSFDNLDSSINIEYLNKNNSIFEKYFSIEIMELTKIHYLYTFKYAFPRVLIPAAISFISYFFTSILSPRRKILAIYLNPDLKTKEKISKYKKISKKYTIIFLIFGTLALFLMAFFFYSLTNYFVIFDDAKYDIPQSFILSGLIRFILDLIVWAIIANIRITSIESRSSDAYGCIRGISEIN